MELKYKFGIGLFILDVIVSLYVWITEPLPEARGLIIIHIVAYLFCLGAIGFVVIILYYTEKNNLLEKHPSIKNSKEVKRYE